MKTSLRIAVADDERDMREFLSGVLTRSGHQVVGACASGEELVKVIRDRHPELVIADVRMPGIDGIEAANLANKERPTPILLVSAHHDEATLVRATAAPVVGYLIKPISEADVKAAVTMAVARFDQFQVLLKDTADLRQALEERKIVERAKGIVMKRTRTDEEDGYRRMRKSASQQNLKLIEVCRRIIAAEEVFQQLDTCNF